MSIYNDFLKGLHKATKNGRLTWVQKGSEFVGNGLASVKIRQVVPLVAGPSETIGPQAFEIEAANVSFTVWDGTEGCDLVRSTLGLAFPQWKRQNQSIRSRLCKCTAAFASARARKGTKS